MRGSVADEAGQDCFIATLLTRFAMAMIVRIGGLPRERGKRVASAT
jgi:hypothetical protein